MWVPHREMSRNVAIMQSINKVSDGDSFAYCMGNVRVSLQCQNTNAIHEVIDFLLAFPPNVVQLLDVGVDLIRRTKDFEELFS